MQSIYSTEHLYIKNLGPFSAKNVLTFYWDNRNYFEPWDQTRFHYFYTVKYQRQVLSAEQRLLQRGSSNRFYLFEKSRPNHIIGSIHFYEIQGSPVNSCKLGYKLAADATHKNYAYEALSFLIPLICNHYHLYRIEAYIMPSNTRSIALIQRLNFHLEGQLKSYCEIHGQRETHNLYTLLCKP